MNYKLKKEFEKGNLEELLRLQKEMAVTPQDSDEYKKLLTEYEALAKIVNDKNTNDVKTKNTIIDNVIGLVGIGASVFFPVVLGRIPNPQSWTFFKSRQKHN